MCVYICLCLCLSVEALASNQLDRFQRNVDFDDSKDSNPNIFDDRQQFASGAIFIFWKTHLDDMTATILKKVWGARGVTVKRSTYGAEGGSIPARDKIFSGLKTLSVHPAVNGYLIKFGEGSKDSEWRGIGSAVHMLCPRHGET